MGNVSLHDQPSESVSMSESSASSEPSAAENESSSSGTTGSDVWSLFDAKVTESHSIKTTQSECLVELRQYLQTKVLDHKHDPMAWWLENNRQYRRLYVLARKYLCVPATSVPSERLFSKAGELISAKRNRLKDKNIDTILFLNKNL